MKGFTEIHSHFVYGVDDGARTQEEMFRMLDAAWQQGVQTIFATSHQVPGMEPFSDEVYQQHLQEAEEYCLQCGYDMDIRAGAEILYTPQLDYYIKDHPLQTLEGSNRVLIEFSPVIALDDIRNALELMEQNRYLPVLAHVERYQCLFKGNACERLKREYAVQLQVNARSVITSAQPLLRRLLVAGWFKKMMIDYVASDAHNLESRPFLTDSVHAALITKYGETYANRLLGATE